MCIQNIPSFSYHALEYALTIVCPYLSAQEGCSQSLCAQVPSSALPTVGHRCHSIAGEGPGSVPLCLQTSAVGITHTRTHTPLDICMRCSVCVRMHACAVCTYVHMCLMIDINSPFFQSINVIHIYSCIVNLVYLHSI